MVARNIRNGACFSYRAAAAARRLIEIEKIQLELARIEWAVAFGVQIAGSGVMTMKITKAMLCVLPTLLATPAMADEVRPYVGPIVGWDHATLKTPIGNGSKDGVVYGGVVGADYVLFNASIIGLEGEFTGASTEERVTSGTTSASLKAGRDLYAGARFGFVLAPHTLAYVKGGYTNARLTGRYTDNTGTYTGSENLDGWRIGAGAEVAMKRFRIRAEYRYSDYGDFKYQGVNTGVKFERQQVVLGLLLDL